MDLGRLRVTARVRRPGADRIRAVLVLFIAVVVAALAWSAAGAASPAHATPIPTASAADAEAPTSDALELRILPADEGVLLADQPLSVQIELTNLGETALPASEFTLSLGDGTLDTRSGLRDWLEAVPEAQAPQLRSIVTSTTVQLDAGERTVFSVTATSEAHALTGESGFGARPLEGRVVLNGQTIASDRSTIVFAPTSQTGSTGLAIVVPITASPSTEALVGSDELAELTAQGGALSELLDAVDGTGATLAIDPKLLLSVRALGEQAPDSARRWLARLQELPNDSFALPYADADLTAQQQAGLADELLLDSAGFAIIGGDAAPSPSSTTAPSSTPAPSSETTPTTDAATIEASADATQPAPTQPEPSPGTASVAAGTLDDLVEFDYTYSGVAWPAAGTITSADLDAFARWGYTRLLVDEGDVQGGEQLTYTASAGLLLDGWSAAASDHELGELFGEALSAEQPDPQDVLVELGAALSVITRELPNEQRTLLLTTGRTIDDPARLGAVLRAIEGLPWSAAAAIPFADGSDGSDSGSGSDDGPGDDSTAVRTASLQQGAHTTLVIDRVRGLLAAERQATWLSSIFDDPEAYRGEQRAALLSALGAGWTSQRPGWLTDTQAFTDELELVTTGVTVAQSSEIHLVGRESELPVSVSNGTDRRVTVQVMLVPASGRIEVADPVSLSIEPGSVARAQIPVQAISNGLTTAYVHLLTPDEQPIGPPLTLQINVQAEWETITVVVLALGVSALFIAGIIRTVRRRRAAAADGTPSEREGE